MLQPFTGGPTQLPMWWFSENRGGRWDNEWDRETPKVSSRISVRVHRKQQIKKLTWQKDYVTSLVKNRPRNSTWKKRSWIQQPSNQWSGKTSRTHWPSNQRNTNSGLETMLKLLWNMRDAQEMGQDCKILMPKLWTMERKCRSSEQMPKQGPTTNAGQMHWRS